VGGQRKGVSISFFHERGKRKKIEVLKKVRIFFGLKQKKLIGFGQVSSNLFIERMHLLKKKKKGKKFKTNQEVKI